MAYDVNYENNITTNEDMLHYKGIDLNNELTDQINDDGAEPAKRAIADVEDWLINYCSLNFDFNKTKDNLSDFQKECFVKAVCEQIDYILDNSDIRNLAGLNADTGAIIDNAVLRNKELAPSAFNWLRRCGMANLRRG